MAKLCPLLKDPCVKEKCAWWIDIEEHEDGGLCSVVVTAFNSGYDECCEHEMN